jgi:outer membrane protein assembly factor BamB
VWTERLGGSISSSPVLLHGKVYAASESDYVFVFQASPQYKLLAHNQMPETIMATPAVAGNRLYLFAQAW